MVKNRGVRNRANQPYHWWPQPPPRSRRHDTSSLLPLVLTAILSLFPLHRCKARLQAPSLPLVHSFRGGPAIQSSSPNHGHLPSFPFLPLSTLLSEVRDFESRIPLLTPFSFFLFLFCLVFILFILFFFFVCV